MRRITRCHSLPGTGALLGTVAAMTLSALTINACGPPPPPDIVISLTGGPTASTPMCGQTRYTVESIITNQSPRDVILSVTAPTQNKLTAGTSTGVGRIAANGATTVRTPVDLDDVCEPGTLGLIFVAGDAANPPVAAGGSTTGQVTIAAQPLKLTQLSPRRILADPATGLFQHGMTFGCCQAGAASVVWTSVTSRNVVNGSPGPPGGQAITCGGGPPVPTPTGVVSAAGTLFQGENAGVTSFIAQLGGNRCLHNRDVERGPAEEEEGG